MSQGVARRAVVLARAILVGGVGLLPLGGAGAQVDGSGAIGLPRVGRAESDDGGPPSKYTVLDTRTARALLEEAEGRLRIGAVREALERLQRVLDAHANELIRVEPGRYRGAGAIASDRIEALPDDAARVYESLYGEKAWLLVDGAGSPPDRARLAAAAARYPRTLAALEALRRIVALDLERGDFEAADHATRTLLARPDLPPAVRAETWLQATRAAAVGGAAERLRELAEEADRPGASFAEDPIVLGVRTPPGDASERIAAQAGPRFLTPGGAALFEPLPAGALTSFRWAIGIENPLLDSRYESGFGGTFPFVPVVRDHVLFLSTGRAVRAIDLFSGERLWSSESPLESEISRAIPSDREGYLGSTSPDLALATAATARAVVANLQVPHAVRRERWRTFDIWQTLPERRLFAFDRETGRQLWSHWSPEVGALTEETVTAPPAAAFGLVVVEAHRLEGKVASFAAAYDERTGAEVWKTYLLTGQEDLNMFGRLFREHAGTAPLVAGGVAYVSTNLGVLAAVDVATGRIRWLSEYESMSIVPNPSPTPTARTFHWQNRPPVLTNGILVATPLDSRYVHAFDAETGEVLWRREDRGLDGAQHRALVGASDGIVVLSGHRLTAIEARDGTTTLWEAETQRRPFVEPGRGTIAGGAVYWPTREGLEVVDLRNGLRRRNAVPWKGGPAFGPGNVAIEEGVLLLLREKSVEAAFDPESLATPSMLAGQGSNGSAPDVHLASAWRRLLERDYAGAIPLYEATLDAAASLPALEARRVRRDARAGLQRARLGRGEALVEDGRPAEALRVLRQVGGTGGNPTPSVRALLLIGTLARELGDEAEAIDAYEAIRHDFPRVRLGADSTDGPDMPAGLVALRELAAMHEAAGRAERAVDALSEAIREFRDEWIALDRHGGAHLRTIDWARDSIESLLDANGREPYAAFEAEAARLLDESRAAGSRSGLEAVLQNYPNSRRAGEAALALADVHASAGRVDEAITSLVRFLRSDRRGQWSGIVLRRLADLAGALGNEPFRARLLERIAEESPDAEHLAEPSLARTAPRSSARDGEGLGSGALEERFAVPLLLAAPGFFEPRGEVPESARGLVVLLDEPSSYLLALGPQGLDPRWKRFGDPNALRLPSFYFGDALIVSSGKGILALEPTQGTELWQISSGAGLVEGLDVQDGLVFSLTRAARDGGPAVLDVADARTGRPLWSLRDLSVDVAAVEPRGGRLLARTRDPNRLQVLDALTGRLLHEFPSPTLAGEADDERVVVPSDRGGIEAFSISTGRRLWEANLPESVDGSEVESLEIALLPDAVAVTLETAVRTLGRSSRRLLFLDASTGALRHATWIAPDATFEVAGDGRTPEVFVPYASEDGALGVEALRPSSGETVWSTEVVETGSVAAQIARVRAAGRDVLVVATRAAVDRPALEATLVRIDRASGRVLETHSFHDDPSEGHADVFVTGGKAFVLKGSVLRCLEAGPRTTGARREAAR